MAAIECSAGTVYQIPMSCGKSYIGQSGVCINCRLYQHQQAIKPKNSGYSTLSTHVKKCKGCTPKFKDTDIIARSGQRKNREILEAFHIDRGGSQVISESSIKLRDEELKILSSIHH
jgi:hypothetical protein